MTLSQLAKSVVAVSLVNSTTTYTYDLRTQTYLQPNFTYQSLQRTLNCNKTILTTLRTQKDHPLERGESVRAGTPLIDLIATGTKDNIHAPAVFSILFSELAKQKRSVMICCLLAKKEEEDKTVMLVAIRCCWLWMTFKLYTAQQCIETCTPLLFHPTTCQCPDSLWSMPAAKNLS
jgi:hypothetical protein